MSSDRGMDKANEVSINSGLFQPSGRVKLCCLLEEGGNWRLLYRIYSKDQPQGSTSCYLAQLSVSKMSLKQCHGLETKHANLNPVDGITYSNYNESETGTQGAGLPRGGRKVPCFRGPLGLQNIGISYCLHFACVHLQTCCVFQSMPCLTMRL